MKQKTNKNNKNKQKKRACTKHIQRERNRKR